MTRRLVSQIEREIERIGAGYKGLGPCSSICVSDEGLPRGYCRYWDDSASAYSKSREFLEALKDLPDGFCLEPAFDDNVDFWDYFPCLDQAEEEALERQQLRRSHELGLAEAEIRALERRYGELRPERGD